MPVPDIAYSALQQIQSLARELTRKPSVNQMSDAYLNNMINRFVLYDFPGHTKMFNLHTTLTFYTSPNIDQYSTNTTNPTDPLYNFNNKYTTVYQTAYIGGYPVFYGQDRDQFYNIYPIVSALSSTNLSGNGTQTLFTGQITNNPFLQNNVIISSIDVNNNAITMIDLPTPGNSVIGNLVVPNTTVTSPLSFVNYLTGEFSVNFPVAPANTQVINSQVVGYVANRPSCILYFDEVFTLRPVPDQAYAVNIEVDIRPAELLANLQMPEMAAWADYIGYGAAIKILQRDMNLEDVARIMPEFKKQERLIMRPTLNQIANVRSRTIYSDSTLQGSNWNDWGWGSGTF
jgi:hypothetical protein